MKAEGKLQFGYVTIFISAEYKFFFINYQNYYMKQNIIFVISIKIITYGHLISI